MGNFGALTIIWALASLVIDGAYWFLLASRPLSLGR